MNSEPEYLIVHKKIFFTVVKDAREYSQNILPTNELTEELNRRHLDIFSFLERRWCCPIPEPSKLWAMAEDNIAILHLLSYEEWWKDIGKKTRNMVRKAEKANIQTFVTEPNEKLAEGIWKIYNETPVRQERAFPHYGLPLQVVKEGVIPRIDETYIGAYLQGELVGFINLVSGDRIAIISQILSLQKHSDKAVNNALIAKAVEICVLKKWEWLMYGRIGNHPSLDNFKRNNGFRKFPLKRFYLPITRKGRIAIGIGLHRDIKDAMPDRAKFLLIPIYNWFSRNKIRFRRPFRRERK